MIFKAGAVLGVLLVGGAAMAAEPSAAWRASRQQLSACLATPDAAARGVCLERAARAMDAAEARGEGPLPSPEQAAVVRRRDYGVRNRPAPPSPPRTPERERADRLATTLASASQNSEGGWVMRTVEGAVWAQTDRMDLARPPHQGSSLLVRPGALGSFFCLIDNRSEVRCKRRS